MSPFTRLLTPKSIPNTGSTARDHLASERTFLAWQRTGLGFIALGLGVERFATLTTPSPASSSPSPSSQARKSVDTQEKYLVGALLGTGASTVVYGAVRYLGNMRALERGRFRPAYGGVVGLAVVLAGGAGWVGWSEWEGVRREGDGG